MISVEKTPLKQVSFAHLQQYKQHFVGWEYPKRDLSPFIRHLDSAQRAAINAWGWLAILLFVCSPILAWYFANLWWLFGAPLSLIVWKSNRKSMEQFFLEKLETDQSFFEFVQRSDLGESIWLLWK